MLIHSCRIISWVFECVHICRSLNQGSCDLLVPLSGVGGTGGGPRGGHGAQPQRNPFSAPVRGLPGSKAHSEDISKCWIRKRQRIWKSLADHAVMVIVSWVFFAFFCLSFPLEFVTCRACAVPASPAVLAAWPWSESNTAVMFGHTFVFVSGLRISKHAYESVLFCFFWTFLFHHKETTQTWQTISFNKTLRL